MVGWEAPGRIQFVPNYTRHSTEQMRTDANTLQKSRFVRGIPDKNTAALHVEKRRKS
jgi:hypothetical protein